MNTELPCKLSIARSPKLSSCPGYVIKQRLLRQRTFLPTKLSLRFATTPSINSTIQVLSARHIDGYVLTHNEIKAQNIFETLTPTTFPRSEKLYFSH